MIFKNLGITAILLAGLSGVATAQSLLLAPDGASFDRFGSSVAASNDYIAVGAFKDDDEGSSSGAVYIFNARTKAYLYKFVPQDLNAGDEFGGAVAIDENILVVGAQFHDVDGVSNTGAAYLYDLDSGSLLKKITAPDAASGDQFGHAVSIDGGKVGITAWKADAAALDSGAAYLFNVVDTNHIKIVPTDGQEADNFGASISVKGERLAVGAPFTDSANPGGGFTADVGSAYVYDLAGSLEWRFSSSEPTNGITFGASVALTTDFVLVGAPGAFGYGAVYAHNLTTGETPIVMTAPVTSASSRFGVSVAANSTRILIGADMMDSPITSQGVAYLFSYSFTHKRTLLHPTPASSDFMGGSVALNSTEAVTSVLQDDDNGSSSGSALAFPLIFGEISNLLIEPGNIANTFILSWSATDEDDTFDIECSTNMIHWQLLESAVNGTEYTVHVQPGERQCFFRIKSAE